MEGLALSNRQAKEADRVGGIELLILWPSALGPEPDLELDHEREASRVERAYAEAMVKSNCQQRGLVPVHVRVCMARRPSTRQPRPGEVAAHLAVTIIGRRWVHATGRPAPLEMWA